MLLFKKGSDYMAKYCSNCGNQLEKGAEYCGNCGKKINEQESKQEGVNVTTEQPKSKIAAGLLGIFLGCFGVHNFYLGYTGKAVAQLLITVLSCFVLSFASAIWGLIEGILILTGTINVDAEGNRLVD